MNMQRSRVSEGIYPFFFRIWKFILAAVILLFIVGFFTSSKLVSQLIFIGVTLSFIPVIGMAAGLAIEIFSKFRR